MNGNYKAVDLHVHTPASSGCYRGEKNRDEYIKILKYYVENNVSLIAITDHNTINGYKTLMDIKFKLNQTMVQIKELENLTGVKSQENNISKELELFEQINIIPGVEIEINPGIHLLVIFNPENDIYEIEKLLIEIGYESEIQGNETGTTTKIDILQLLERLKNVDCIVIGAHIDSNKGIYQTTSGTYRVNILTNERLDGLQFNSQTQADSIETMFKTDPKYKRKSSVAFLKASDFHGDYESSIQKTYFYLEEDNYLNLKECFNSPEEKISLTSNPEYKTIINKILASPNSLAVDSLQDDIKFAEKICAILNEGFGYIVIGVKENEHKNIIGTNQDKEEIKAIFNKLINNVKANSSKIKISISKYDWTDKYIHIISLNSKRNTLHFLSNDKSYYLDKSKVKEYNTEEIIDRASSNMDWQPLFRQNLT